MDVIIDDVSIIQDPDPALLSPLQAPV